MAKKLLLADDSITIQKVVELVLSEEDFQIKAVNNGQDALDHMDAFKPDIVLADIEMPQVNGYQLCERIKQNRATESIPVLLLAGAFEPLDDDLARNVGADGYIIKPFESQELISKVNAALTSASMGRGSFEEPAEAIVAEEEPVALATPVSESIVAEAVEAEEEDLWTVEDVEVAHEQADEKWTIPEEADMVQEVPQVEEPIVEIPVKRGPAPSGEPPRPLEPEKKPGATIASRSWEQPVKPSSPSAPKAPSPEEVMMAVQQEIRDQITSVLQDIDFIQIISAAVSDMVGKSMDQAVTDTVPKLLEQSISDMLAGSFSSIKQDVEKVIWETVPDLAETIIRKEIEKIKSGS